MLEYLSTYITSLLPEGFDPFEMLHSLLYIVGIVLIITLLIRLVHQKTSQYNHAVSSAAALMFMYLLLLQLRRFMPDLLDPLVDQLPLIDFDPDAGKIGLYQFSVDRFAEGCTEFLYLFILSFCLIGLDDLIPDAKNVASWMILQFIIVCLALAIYSFVLKILAHFFPGILDSLAPMILVCILLFMVFLGLLKVVLTLVLAAVNPLLGAISAFFSTNKLGMALGKAVMCSLVMISMAIFMYCRDLTSFMLADMTLPVCFLPMALLALVWVVTGHIL